MLATSHALAGPGLLRRAFSALLLALAIACAVPAAPSPAFKHAGSAFSADTVDMAVLPARMVARAAPAPTAPEPMLALPPTIRFVHLSAPAIAHHAADWPRSRAPPPFDRLGAAIQPRGPPSA